MVSSKSTREIKHNFARNYINRISTPGSIVESRDSSNNKSMIESNKSNLLKVPRISASKHSSNKFGFSTQQYKKLQIIKASRLLNLKLIVSLNRLKYSKFYFCTLSALVELINIIHANEKAEIKDWQTLITYLSLNQSKILNDISETPNACEKSLFDKQALCDSRKNYFGDVPSETLLFKY